MTNKKRIGLNVPTALYMELKQEANASGQTLNGLIVQILWEWKKKIRANRTKPKQNTIYGR